MILKTKQNLHGAEKIRVITKNKRILQEFCDDPYAPTVVSPMFFPLKGFFYAPVVGAPSTTAMVTNIDLFKLDELKKISDASGIRRLGIEKPESAIHAMVSEQVICGTLMGIKASDPERFIKIIHSLPRYNEILGEDENAYTNYNISKYLHSITKDEIYRVISKVPGADKEIGYRMNLFSDPVPAEVSNTSDIRDLLRGHVLKFILKKKDCKLSSITCTNDDTMLRSIYGRDYFAKYEGFNIRFSRFIDALTDGVDVKEALIEYGFSADPEILEKIDELTKADSVDEKSFGEALRQVVAENEGVRLRSSSKDSDNIIVRLLNAYIDEDGKVQDYYRSIDPDAIVDILILS